jgi:hypothetical protein
MNNCMNVCIVKRKINIQKELHTATKPLKLDGTVHGRWNYKVTNP